MRKKVWFNKTKKIRDYTRALWKLVLVLLIAMFFSCGSKDEPMPVPKKDHPTEFSIKTTGLPVGVSIDVATQTIKVPESLSAKAIEAIFYGSTVSDKDGEAAIKKVSIVWGTIHITLEGKNGKDQTIKETNLTWKLVRVALSATFPSELPGSQNLKAGDTTFIARLLNMPILLNDGSEKTPKAYIRGEEVNNNYSFLVPWDYSLTLKIEENGKTYEHTYQLHVLPAEVEKDNIEKYTKEATIHFNSINPRIHSRSQIEWVADRMHLGSFDILTSKVLKPSHKKVVVFEQREPNSDWTFHSAKATMEEIVANNNEVDYQSAIVHQQEFDPTIQQALEEMFRRYDFVILEDNWGNKKGLWWAVFNHTNAYMFATEFGPYINNKYTHPETLSNQGEGIVNYPVIIWDDNKLYTWPWLRWPNPKNNPMTNSINSPLLWGLNLGGTSYCADGNAAIGGLIANFLQRIEGKVTKSSFNAILKDKRWLQDVYYAYYPDWDNWWWENTEWTNRVVAYLLDLQEMVKQKGIFALNPALKNLSSGNTKIPLFKNYDKINSDYIKIKEKKGIVKENGIYYVDYTLLQQQGFTVDNLQYDIVIIADPNNPTTYCFKYENLSVK